MQQIKCPACADSARIVHYSPDAANRTPFMCRHCKGTRLVTDEQARDIQRGVEIRENRRARGVSLRERAAQLCMAPSVLSDVENGIGLIEYDAAVSAPRTHTGE